MLRKFNWLRRNTCRRCPGLGSGRSGRRKKAAELRLPIRERLRELSQSFAKTSSHRLSPRVVWPALRPSAARAHEPVWTAIGRRSSNSLFCGLTGRKNARQASSTGGPSRGHASRARSDERRFRGASERCAFGGPRASRPWRAANADTRSGGRRPHLACTAGADRARSWGINRGGNRHHRMPVR
jgi:hypothetical protein